LGKDLFLSLSPTVRGAESQGGATIIVDTEASTPALAMPISSESSPAVPESLESLPTLEEMLGLPNREVTECLGRVILGGHLRKGHIFPHQNL
jgi:hypothetical protein